MFPIIVILVTLAYSIVYNEIIDVNDLKLTQDNPEKDIMRIYQIA